MTADPLGVAVAVLIACKEKLHLYFEQDQRYHGGVPLQALNSQIDEAIAGLGPIDMILFCPACHKQHIDSPETRNLDVAGKDAVWTNPPHKSHLCHGCGCIWRPADVPTNGVASIKTKGDRDRALISAPPAAVVERSAFAHADHVADEQLSVLRQVLKAGGGPNLVVTAPRATTAPSAERAVNAAESKRLLALAEKATPGPWSSEPVMYAGSDDTKSWSESEGRIINGPPQTIEGDTLSKRWFTNKHDGALIAAAHDMAAHIRKLEAELTRGASDE